MFSFDFTGMVLYFLRLQRFSNNIFLRDQNRGTIFIISFGYTGKVYIFLSDYDRLILKHFSLSIKISFLFFH